MNRLPWPCVTRAGVFLDPREHTSGRKGLRCALKFCVKTKKPRLVDRHGLVENRASQFRDAFGGREAFGDNQVDDNHCSLPRNCRVSPSDLVGRTVTKDHLACARQDLGVTDLIVDIRPKPVRRNPQATRKAQLARRPLSPLEGERGQQIAEFSGPRPAQLAERHEFREKPPNAQPRHQESPGARRAGAKGDARPSTRSFMPASSGGDGQPQRSRCGRPKSSPRAWRQWERVSPPRVMRFLRPKHRATVSPMEEGFGAT